MTGVEDWQKQTASSEAFPPIRFDSSFDSQLDQLESHSLAQSSSFEETEWNPVEFDLQKPKNPKWKKDNRSHKPKRIQDICLTRLDSDGGGGASSVSGKEPDAAGDDNWPYEAPDSPCALFGAKTKMSSSPAEGFKGEFSGGDPEWDPDNQSKRSTGSSRDKSSRRKSSSRRLMQAQQQQKQQEEDDEGDDDGSDHSAGSYELETASQSGSEEEEDCSDESEHSVTDSPTYDDDNLMVTPAMGKTRETRKKPPTLKRGAHQVATPSIVKAMKDKHAFTVSDDEGDNGSIDFDAEFDSDLESAGSTHSRKNKGENGSRSKREGRLEAANTSFRRASMSKKKDFKFDRSMSSADLKAARKANNSFKGHTDMNKSFGTLESRRRAQRTNSRRQERMQNSFSSTSGAMSGSNRKTASSHGKSPPAAGRSSSTRRVPSRAKSMGNPTTGTTKLKSALSKFSGSMDEPPSATSSGSKKSYGATLSALKVLSGADGGGGESKGDGESDLKSAIMQQVYRSSSMNPVEIKIRPKPKMTKSYSLSASGMARAAAASGDVFPPKDAASKDTKESKQGRVRRAKTANEKSSSISDLGASYHESIAKMRKQKMADASERSAMSIQSTASSSRSQSTHEPKESTRESSSSKDRNIGRAKSFSHPSRAGSALDEEAEAEVSAEPSSSGRPRMKRGSSKRLQNAEVDLEGADSGHSSKRSLQKSGSSRRLQKEGSTRMYDASPQRPSGTNVIALLKNQEPVTDSQMMQKGNRQMFHALMFKTRMGIDMDQLRQKVEGGSEDDGSASDTSK